MSNKLCILSILVLIGVSSPVAAQELRFDSVERGQREVSVGLAYGENYQLPSATRERRAFEIVQLRYGWFTSPTTQLAVRLVNGRTHSFDKQAGVSVAGDYRRYFAIRGDTAIGYDLSFGLSYFAGGFTDQGTRFNFTEQVGLLVTRSIDEDTSLSLEYCFSHTSNAGIKLPNVGLNAGIFVLSYSWYP